MWFHLTVLALLAAGYWIRQRLSHWKRHGVASVEPTFPQGNLGGLGKTRHMAQVLQDCYAQLKGRGPFGGVYFFINPAALLIDLDLVKAVLVKDFAAFHDRQLYHNNRDDPLSRHLVAMEGAKWRSLRAKLTPTFTSGKMKLMFSTVTTVAEEFTRCVAGEIATDARVEMKELLARFTTDVIGTVAFGLECNSLKDANARFRVMGRKVFEPSRYRAMKAFLAAQFPQVACALRVTLTPKEISDFFLGVVRDTIRFRETHDVRQRNDFMTLLMKVMKEDVLSGKAGAPADEQLTMDDLAAQAFVFFLAGFETSSTTMSFCLYELALHQDLQDKARANIEEVLRRHDSISYEAVHEMKYIEMCINESLRKYPPATTLTRKANENYRVAGTDHVLPDGLMVLVPVYAIHHDPEHFPDPERFNPERFSPEETARRHPFAFLPFGEGPRICIGLRFGMMQARIGLVYLLKHFRFTLDERKMSVPVKISPSSPVLTIDGGLWLNVEKL